MLCLQNSKLKYLVKILSKGCCQLVFAVILVVGGEDHFKYMVHNLRRPALGFFENIVTTAL